MNTKSAVHIIAHGSDLDGIVSAALIKRYYEENHRDVKVNLHFCSHGDVADEIKIVFMFELDCLFLLDIPINDDGIADFIRDKKDLCKIVYIDHHNLNERNYSVIKDASTLFIVASDQCTAELVEKNYKIENRNVQSELVELARTMDFMLKNNYSILCIRLANAMSSMDKEELVEFSEDLLDGHVYSNGFILSEKYARYEVKGLGIMGELRKQIVDTIRIVEKGSLSFGSVLIDTNNYVMKNLFLAFWEYNSNLDVYIVCDENKQHVAIAKNPTRGESMKIDQYCIDNGGGGRNDAGGFEYSEEINRGSYYSVIENIVDDINAYFNNNMERKNG